MAATIRLNKNLFKDDESYNKLVKVVRATVNAGHIIILLPADSNEAICAAVSPDMAKEMLHDKIMKLLECKTSTMAGITTEQSLPDISTRTLTTKSKQTKWGLALTIILILALLGIALAFEGN